MGALEEFGGDLSQTPQPLEAAHYDSKICDDALKPLGQAVTAYGPEPKMLLPPAQDLRQRLAQATTSVLQVGARAVLVAFG